MLSPAGDLSPLDPATMAIEVDALGVGAKATRRFTVLNPTSVPHDFVWEAVPVPGQGSQAHVFHCGTRMGTVSAGRRYEMEFDFTPRADAPQEAFWNFRIPLQVRALALFLVQRCHSDVPNCCL
jgi:hypothetical protein